jgi:ribosomal protein L28
LLSLRSLKVAVSTHGLRNIKFTGKLLRAQTTQCLSKTRKTLSALKLRCLICPLCLKALSSAELLNA